MFRIWNHNQIWIGWQKCSILVREVLFSVENYIRFCIQEQQAYKHKSIPNKLLTKWKDIVRSEGKPYFQLQIYFKYDKINKTVCLPHIRHIMKTKCAMIKERNVTHFVRLKHFNFQKDFFFVFFFFFPFEAHSLCTISLNEVSSKCLLFLLEVIAMFVSTKPRDRRFNSSLCILYILYFVKPLQICNLFGKWK